MLAIFTIPKAFKGHTAVIQRNAVESWMRLGCEVYLCGDDPGVGETAQETGATWIPDIERNAYGTPILRSAFHTVAARSAAEVLCFVNADIIFLRDLVEAVRKVRWRKTVLAGQRWDLDVEERIDFGAPDVEEQVRARLASRGRLHGPLGSDYFIFRRDSALLDIPPFGVGRPGWDCWFIYHVRRLGFRMVDATSQITVVHQNHDYSHLTAKSGSTQDGKKWKGPEVEANERLIGSEKRYFTLEDATHLMENGAVRRALDYEHLRSRWYRVPELNPWFRPLHRLMGYLAPQPARRALRRLLG